MRIPIVVTTLCASSLAAAQTALPSSPELPTVALWLNRDTMASGEAEIVELLDACQERGVEVVMPNFWFRGHVSYPGSAFVPQWPTFEGWDPMEVVVREAHARGIKVWPWGEYGFFTHFDPVEGEDDPGAILREHPEWEIRSASGEVGQWHENPAGRHHMVNPANPEAREFIASLMLEVAARYEVDGINLDRIRYMSPEWGYDEYSQEAFASDERIDLDAPAAFDQWRRLVINDFMQEFAERWRAAHPDLPITAAVNPPYMFEDKFQHWEDWAHAGQLDVAIPMIYGGNDLVRQEVERSLGMLPPGAPLLAGLDASQGDEALAEQIRIARELGASGVAIWDEQAFLRGTVSFAP